MRLKGFTKKQILEVYNNMAVSRRLDEKMLKVGCGDWYIKTRI